MSRRVLNKVIHCPPAPDGCGRTWTSLIPAVHVRCKCGKRDGLDMLPTEHQRHAKRGCVIWSGPLYEGTTKARRFFLICYADGRLMAALK